jgi:hypothetical protein
MVVTSQTFRAVQAPNVPQFEVAVSANRMEEVGADPFFNIH